MDNKPQVIFRRVNGRIVPIRTKNGQVSRARKKSKDGLSDKVEDAVNTGGAAGTLAYGKAKATSWWLGRRVAEQSGKIAAMPKVARPSHPVFKQFAKRVKEDPDFAGTPLGDLSRSAKAKVNYTKALKRYRGRFAEYSENFLNRRDLRAEKIKSIKFQRILNRNALGIAGIAALGAGVFSLGRSLYKGDKRPNSRK